MRWLYPLERSMCGLWPGLLAFQFVILARPASLVRFHDETSTDTVPSDLAALETFSSKR
jgi:hypothetical protein